MQKKVERHDWARTDFTYLICRRCKITDIEAAMKERPDECDVKWAEKLKK